MEPTTISILTFITVILAVLGVHQVKTAEQQKIENRMNWLSAKQVKEKINSMYAETREKEKKELWRELLNTASNLFLARKLGSMVENKLTEADLPLRGAEFIVITASSGLAAGAFFTVVTMNPQIGVIAFIVALIIPFMFLRVAHTRRLNSFNAQIGDAMSIMSNSLRSGFNFLQAMDMVRKELPNPISKEFARTFREINLGASTEEALQNMVDRVKSDDLDLVITLVLIQRQVGGNLAEVLDNIGNTIRERIRIKNEIKTITAQGRISGLIIGLLPVALMLMIYTINPGYIMTLFTTTAGQLMLAAAAFGEILGALLIKKIITIEV